MPTPSESRAALKLVASAAVAASAELLNRFHGSPEVRRAALLESVPELIGMYGEGTAALAADFYDEQRELARVRGVAYSASLEIVDRTVKIRRGIAWSALPLFDGDEAAAQKRLAEVVQLETARPFRDTIRMNQRQDPESVGWRRITRGGCKLCRMLADRGAVYRHDSALFAAHPHCNCGAQPVFKTDVGEEASVMQYTASLARRTPKQQAALRDYLAANY